MAYPVSPLSAYFLPFYNSRELARCPQIKAEMSLPRSQKLIYIVPKHHEKMDDYSEFLNACKKACGLSASLGNEKCSADALGPVYLDYISNCKKDYNGCACEITYMYCGSVPYPASALCLAPLTDDPKKSCHTSIET